MATCASSGLPAEVFYDTAGAVKHLKESGALDTAAIASHRAADVYGMQILAEGIEDNPANFTRFLVISPRTRSDPANDEAAIKTTIVFTLKNQPGSLFKALSVFALRDIDLTKIESRPLVGSPGSTCSTSTLLAPAPIRRPYARPGAPGGIRRLAAGAWFISTLPVCTGPPE